MKALDQILGVAVGIVVVTIAASVTGAAWFRAAGSIVARRAREYVG